MMGKIFETEVDRQWLGEDGILYVEILPNAEMTLANAQQSTETFKQVTGGKKRPLLIDISRQKSMSREAREHKAGKAVENDVLALALVMTSPVGKVLGNLYYSLSKPSFPVRLFTSKNEAVEWLKSFLE
jgi:hypothetical protein